MEQYSWLETEKGNKLSTYAKELHGKMQSMSVGESSMLLGSAMAASIRWKAIELDISPEEAVDYFFHIMARSNVILIKKGETP
jgi:hypothetical protein